ncbi:MAG: hypothetical protein JST30_01725 [Armatimonadetes bacterium]|nr:hypothetical protein [Armatimonadota bacterium]
MRSFLALAFALAVVPGVAFAQTSLEAGFKNPPDSAKPHTWWHWMNGNVSKAGITADLEAMKRIGLGGAQIFNVDCDIPEGRTPFMSAQWKEAVAHAFREAKRLGIEICVHNCAGWSSSGGPWVTPEHAMQILTWSETPVTGPSRFEGRLPQPESKLGFYRDIAVYAVRKPQDDTFRIPNIRAKAAFDRGDRIAPDTTDYPEHLAVPIGDVRMLKADPDGKVVFDAPAGEWTLIRLGHTPTGKGNHPSPPSGYGPEIDKMSREAMDQHWAGMMDTVLKANGPVSGKGLNNALIDSYEVGSQNWTPKFREEFTKRRGYDPLPFLPVVTGRLIGSGETSERFLWDLRRTVSDLFADNYFAYFGELCRKNGLLFSTEGYGNGSFDNLQVSGMADVPMGEFWSFDGMAQETTKLAASAAHTNGRKFVGAEAFTADENQGRFQIDPYSIKALGDRIFSYGINRYIFHRYAHQPWTGVEPGMTMGPWGMHLDRTETWWDQGSAWMKYIARCQYLLQSGRFVADVLVFTGEEGPNDLPMMKGTVVPNGYDYDGCDLTVLQKARVDKGETVLPSGMRYRLLVLPDSRYMTLRTLKTVEALVRAGATVVGPKPQFSPSLSEGPDADKAVRALADKVWGPDGGPSGGFRYGSGKTYGTSPLADVLKSMVGPDVTVNGAPATSLNWIHRLVDQSDVYFVANPKYASVTRTIGFRVADLEPELWDPETGSVSPAPLWQRSGGRTNVTLPFGPAQSVFVVFRKPAKGAHTATAQRLDPSGSVPVTPKIGVVSARYEAVDGTGGVDVTQKVAQMVAEGSTEISANNSNFGDPTYNHVKHLKIVYTVDGKRIETTVAENGVLAFVPVKPDDVPPDFEFVDGKMFVWNPGFYAVTDSKGGSRTWRVPAPKETPVKGPWTVGFQKGRGAPAQARFDTLASWTENTDSGVKFFSGTATYTTTFDVAPSVRAGGQTVWLDLGKVKNFADVTLNGRRFPTLWKAPFRLDVTKAVQSGANRLEVKVTNLWPNRLIGDEQLPDENEWRGSAIAKLPDWALDMKPRPKSDRVAWTTWHFFRKDSKLLESGLIGPVRLRSSVPVPLVKSAR